MSPTTQEDQEMLDRIDTRVAELREVGASQQEDVSHPSCSVHYMRRSYKFPIKATSKQYDRLRECLSDHCTLYNAALQERRDSYERVVRKSANFYGEKPKAPVSYYDQQKQLTQIRAEHPEIGRWSSTSEQDVLRRLNKAFEAFFRRVKTGQEPGFPRFKSRDRYDSITFGKHNAGCKFTFSGTHSRLYLKGVGHLRVLAHREVEGDIKTLTVKREGRKWFVILSCDGVAEKPLPQTGKSTGIDMGITVFAAMSDGETIDNPRYFVKGAEGLADAQRSLAQKMRGSKRRQKAREQVGRRHRKIANQRRDFHHKTARRLVQQFDTIVIEDLNVKNMSKSSKGTSENPGTNVAAKSGLNRSINDAGWAQFRSILEAKAEEAGRRVIAVNPRHTSQTCHECGHVDAGNRVSQAVFSCRMCGHEDNADTNAARNIFRAGSALQVDTA